MSDKNHDAPVQSSQETPVEKPTYSPPVIRPMDESEVLRTFQVTSASISWWVM